ncbi:MAG: DUF4337 domain-containing protein [Candidatus Omnitrophica bacterium]|nr:DUF4337 domain-containing protein [Candidatus Omnitrophota bacterium]
MTYTPRLRASVRVFVNSLHAELRGSARVFFNSLHAELRGSVRVFVNSLHAELRGSVRVFVNSLHAELRGSARVFINDLHAELRGSVRVFVGIIYTPREDVGRGCSLTVKEEKMAEILQEKWMRAVAVTTTILAVLTSIAASRSAYCVAQSQILTAKEGSSWAYYQAKSIKQNLAETQRKAFEVDLIDSVGERLTRLTEELNQYQSEIYRYEKEKADIKKQAEDYGKENAINGRKGNQFSLAVVFFQIGIMLSSVAALLKRKEMWIVGMIFGIIATVYLANGLFLFF